MSSVLDTINKVVDLKLQSKSFTNVLEAMVVGLNPVTISIDDRLTLGEDFLDFSPSLKSKETSPGSPLYLLEIGDRVRVIRYQGGQRYLVLENIDARPMEVKVGTLDTRSTGSLPTSVERFNDDIKLHKVSKSGSYNDLSNKPTIPNGNDYVKKSGDTMTGPLKGTTADFTGQMTQNSGLKVMDEVSTRHWVRIVSGQNLNDFVNNGKYGIGTNAEASNVANTPENTAGWLEVQSLRNFDTGAGTPDVAWANILQTYTTLSGKRYERTISSDGNGAWRYGGWTTSRIALDIFPVGSVYITVINQNPQELFGGTWIRFGSGHTLVGVNENDTDFNTPLKVGGSKTNTISLANMPSHDHTFSATTSSGGAHTHSVSGTAASAGAHTHNYFALRQASTSKDTQQGASWGNYSEPTTSAGAHTHSVSGTAASAGAHTHTVSGTTSQRGSGTALNTMDPYVTVYFWRRTA